MVHAQFAVRNGRPERARMGNDFDGLWLGESISLLGNQVSLIAMPLAAITLGVSPADLGLLAAAFTAPIAILGLPAGVVIDKFDLRRVMITCDLARALATAAVPIAAAMHSLSFGLLLVVALVNGLFAVVFDVGYQSLVPRIVPKEQLVTANARFEMSRAVGQVLGPGAAGLLTSVVSAATTIAIDAASFLVSALAVSRVRGVVVRPSRVLRPSWNEMFLGVKFVLRDRVLRPTVLSGALVNLTLGFFLAEQVLYGREVLHLSNFLIGVAVAAQGPAAFVGAIISRRLKIRRSIVWGLLVVGGGVIVSSAAAGGHVGAFAMLAVGQFFIGIGAVLFNVSAVTMRQLRTPEAMLGRVNSAARVLIMTSQPAGAVSGGILAAFLGLRLALLSSSAVVLIALIWLVWALRSSGEIDASM